MAGEMAPLRRELTLAIGVLTCGVPRRRDPPPGVGEGGVAEGGEGLGSEDVGEGLGEGLAEAPVDDAGRKPPPNRGEGVGGGGGEGLGAGLGAGLGGGLGADLDPPPRRLEEAVADNHPRPWRLAGAVASSSCESVITLESWSIPSPKARAKIAMATQAQESRFMVGAHTASPRLGQGTSLPTFES